MGSIQLFLSQFMSARTFLRVLEVFGGMWLILELIAFFSEPLANSVKPYWWAFLAVGIILSVVQAWPRMSRKYKLQGRDVQIELIVGDIFKSQGDLIVGSNTTFDTDIQNGLISKNSIQGVFSEQSYSSLADLDAVIDSELANVPFDAVVKKGKSKRYPMGTVCRVPTAGFTSFWIAIADINEHGTARSTFQNLRDALPQLWEQLAQRGSRGPLRVPVLGSGFSRIKEPRERIIKEIIRSFIASCSEYTYCEHLLIHIHPHDYQKHKINLDDLDRFMQYQCAYTDFSEPSNKGQGTAIE